MPACWMLGDFEVDGRQRGKAGRLRQVDLVLSEKLGVGPRRHARVELNGIGRNRQVARLHRTGQRNRAGQLDGQAGHQVEAGQLQTVGRLPGGFDRQARGWIDKRDRRP